MERILRHWLALSQNGKSLETFFTLNRIKTIAIYGCAYLGGALYDDAAKYGIDVKYCIDRDVDVLRGMETLKPNQLSDISSIDAVVICTREIAAEEISAMLRKAGLPFISLYQILMICYYKEIFIPYCKSLGLTPYIFSRTGYNQIPCLSPFEKAISENNLMTASFIVNPRYFEDIYGDIEEYGDEYIRSVFTFPPIVIRNGILMQSDILSQNVNISQGVRFTTHTPESFDRSIYIMGNCTAMGYGVDDSRTIASYLQRMLNEQNNSKSGIRVVNRGTIGNHTNDPLSYYDVVSALPHKSGDVVVMFNDWFAKNDPFVMDCFIKVLNVHRASFHNTFDNFCSQRSHPLYIDNHHLSHHGMKRVAETIMEALKRENEFEAESAAASESGATVGGRDSAHNILTPPPVIGISPESGGRLDEYIAYIRSHKMGDYGSSGAIVMNCNPFTNGHRYLIETAAAQVDYLYIFVVSEDKSIFSFEDRLKLVKAGIADIKNAAVLRSGEFILSALTFPEYFVKDEISEITVDTSVDIELFASKIAPVLNIKKRFVGQEPLDPITRQYNQTMKDILPRYDVECVEIERREYDGSPISASRVRKLMASESWHEISSLVPETTLVYLRGEKYN